MFVNGSDAALGLGPGCAVEALMALARNGRRDCYLWAELGDVRGGTGGDDLVRSYWDTSQEYVVKFMTERIRPCCENLLPFVSPLGTGRPPQ